VVAVPTGLVVVLVAKHRSAANTPAAVRSVVSVRIPPSGIPGVTPGAAPDYQVLVLSGSALKNLPHPDVQPWSLVGDRPNGGVGTIGNIVLCATGRPGPLTKVSVAPLRGSHPLQVVGFSTRPVESQLLGFNRGTLEGSGFSPGHNQVSQCNGSYQQALIGVHNVATTELGVELKMTSALEEEDKGLILTYHGPDGTLRTLDVPIDVTFCASAQSCR
jgi:hypothetical protein